ncbi:hypothetical protein CRUP_006311 [Coryphaenoides rupestris]|nr:hypothetical protein CRUP_006311 [Coryphaenoides rupestris]
MNSVRSPRVLAVLLEALGDGGVGQVDLGVGRAGGGELAAGVGHVQVAPQVAQGTGDAEITSANVSSEPSRKGRDEEVTSSALFWSISSGSGEPRKASSFPNARRRPFSSWGLEFLMKAENLENTSIPAVLDSGFRAASRGYLATRRGTARTRNGGWAPGARSFKMSGFLERERDRDRERQR